MNEYIKRVVTSAVALGLAACSSQSLSPVGAVTKSEILEQQEPLRASLSLGEAMARATLYNLDNRVQMMEHVIASGNADLEHFNMLPQLALNAGYFKRDREDLSSSKNAITGLASPATGTSSDREQVVGSLGETWSMLDLGIALVRSKQLQAREQAAQQRQRQSLQNILSETRYAFAKATIAQHTKKQVDAMLNEINVALADQQQVEQAGVLAPLDILRQQRNLLAVYNELLTLRQSLVSAERELNALISFAPGIDVALEPQAARAVPEPLRLNSKELETLEMSALLMHPELRIADSEVLVHQREIRRTLLSMLPDLELGTVGHYTSNDFSVQSVYNNLSARVTHNLLNLYRWPVQKRHDQVRLELEEEKRLALSLAVVTKIHVAVAHFNALRDEYAFASKEVIARSELAETVSARYQAGEATLHERLTAQLFALDARLNAQLLAADMHNAIGQIYTNVGIDTLPQTARTEGLAELAALLQARVEEFDDVNENLIPMAVNKAIVVNLAGS